MKKILFLLAILIPTVVFAQATRTIKGKVLDQETKEALLGATVFIDPKGGVATDYNPQGTVADLDGNFTFTLPKEVKSVLVSYIGYEVKKLDITKGTDFVVYLDSDSKVLQDVVVTGYQKIEKRKLTSAIQKIDMAELAQVGVSSVDQLLEGKMAGVFTTPTASGPGGASKIRIRGTATLGGTADPLWVIDGMPLEDPAVSAYDKENLDNLSNISIAGLNPDDIADITILKDAAATAIYGARAANGVIVVTTKRGKKGSLKVNVNAATFYTMRPDFSKLNLMNASEKVDFELMMARRSDLTYNDNKGDISRILAKYGELDAYRANGFGGLSTQAQTEINGLRNSGIDWGKEIYRATLNQQYGLSVSGGTDIINYYLSTGYYKEEGNVKGTGFDRFNFTSNTDINLSKKLKIGVNFFGSQTKNTSFMNDTDAFTNPTNYSRQVNPYRTLRNGDGSFAYDPDIKGTDNRYFEYNYAEELANTSNEMNTTSLKGVVNLDYEVIRGLKLTTQLGLQYDMSATEKLAENDTYFRRKYKDYSRYTYKYKDADGKDQRETRYFMPDGGIIQNWNNQSTGLNWRLQAEYSKRFNELHDVDVMLGSELRSHSTKNIHTKGFGFNSRTLQTIPINLPDAEHIDESVLDSFTKSPRFKQYVKNVNENRYTSTYATASYTYDNRYTMFGSIRFDGSDLFGVDPKYRFTPLWSVSAAWNANREEFLKQVSWLSNLKLRASVGVQGNVDKNTSYVLVGEWGNGSVFPGYVEDNIEVTSPPNQTLRWETTTSYNYGIDFGALDGRINLTLDAYYRDSKDLIGLRAIPSENGFIYTNMNWARLTNKGFEISLSTVNIRNKNFSWSTDFNISKNVSKVKNINVRDDSYLPSLQGYPAGAQFAIKTAGLDENGYPMFMQDGNKVSAKEFFKLEETIYGTVMSNLSHKDFRDLYTYIGDADPKLTGGIINKFKYKNFDLSIAANFNIKQTVKETPFYSPTEVDRGFNFPTKMNQVWTPENTSGIYPGMLNYGTQGQDAAFMYQWYGSDPANTFRNYDIWFKEISFMRISSIRLGYSLPSEILKNKFISSARFTLEARNPFVFGSNYDGYFDPESYGNIYAQPLPRSFSVGVNLTF
ncbi:MAG: SusC/RagA family TonB-linked outer membrane protein [Bacteroidales bacterium]